LGFLEALYPYSFVEQLKFKIMNATAMTAQSNVSDYLDTTTVFGDVKKRIVSKDFKGGKIGNVFGQTVIDFTDADISGVVELDISQAFGEIHLIVPIRWRVETDLSQFLAGTRDKREDVNSSKDAEKVLVVNGNSVFAAIHIMDSI
jgi:predicted membrane protein